MAGPSLAGVATSAQQTVDSAAYKGRAKDVSGYLRASIVQPSAHAVAGAMYSASGVSFMPATYGKDLTPDQIDHLVETSWAPSPTTRRSADSSAR